MRFVASLFVFLLAFLAGPAFADKKKDDVKEDGKGG